MAFLFLIAFIAIPLVEISVFIKVGGLIGLWPTIAIVIMTAVIGTALLRQQGISVLFKIQENLEANRLPVRELFDGVCLVVAGVLLLTPGFVTDALGFLLFIPPLRQMVAAWIGSRIVARADVRFGAGAQAERYPRRAAGSGPVIDGEFEDVTPADSNAPTDPHRHIGDNNTDPKGG